VLRYRLAGKPATPAPEQAKACWYQWFMATARRHRAFDPEKALIDVDPLEDKRHTPHVTE
jgi:hypothetical protein